VLKCSTLLNPPPTPHPPPRYLNEQLGALLENSDDIDDSPTRSALLWMDAFMHNPSTGAMTVDPVTLEAMGVFLRAAENLEAFKWWADAFGANHTHMNIARLVEVRGVCFVGVGLV